MIFFAISPCMSYTSWIMNGKVKTISATLLSKISPSRHDAAV